MSNIYKALKLGFLRFAINRFPTTAKSIKCGEHGYVYRSGLHRWRTFVDNNYSLVLGRWRVIVSIDHRGACCGEINSKQKETL